MVEFGPPGLKKRLRDVAQRIVVETGEAPNRTFNVFDGALSGLARCRELTSLARSYPLALELLI